LLWLLINLNEKSNIPDCSILDEKKRVEKTGYLKSTGLQSFLDAGKRRFPRMVGISPLPDPLTIKPDQN